MHCCMFILDYTSDTPVFHWSPLCFEHFFNIISDSSNLVIFCLLKGQYYAVVSRLIGVVLYRGQPCPRGMLAGIPQLDLLPPLQCGAALCLGVWWPSPLPHNNSLCDMSSHPCKGKKKLLKGCLRVAWGASGKKRAAVVLMLRFKLYYVIWS